MLHEPIQTLNEEEGEEKRKQIFKEELMADRNDRKMYIQISFI